ncbi:MAG: acyl carrier protein [Frankiales bacterium]|jgi:acyl carrier protein|nr:acyl carrier protein [Frankiales bacterium]
MTREQVLALVRERGVALGVPAGPLLETARFADDLGLDSLSLVEWALSLEEAFDVELPEEQVTSIETVGALVDLLLAQLDP